MEESRDGVAVATVPAYALYGEALSFPDILHCETLVARAARHEWVIQPHRHNSLHQFFLMLDGGGQLHLDGSTEEMVPPVVINMPRGAVHGFRFIRGSNGFVLTIPLVELSEVFALGGWTAQALSRAFMLPAPAQLAALFASLHAEFLANHPARSTMLRALATQVACIVSRAHGIGSETAADGVSGARIVRFAELVREHVRDHWRVADYARVMDLSPTHLARICRATTGTSARGFIEGALFQEACRLIAYTTQDIASIGYDLGFDDASYFSRAFRRHVGMTPSAYRARLGN